MQAYRTTPGLLGFLLIGLAGVGAGYLNGSQWGGRIRALLKRETNVVWQMPSPVSQKKRRNLQSTQGRMKQVINWKAGQLEWVRQEVQDEQSLLNNETIYRRGAALTCK